MQQEKERYRRRALQLTKILSFSPSNMLDSLAVAIAVTDWVHILESSFKGPNSRQLKVDLMLLNLYLTLKSCSHNQTCWNFAVCIDFCVVKSAFLFILLLGIRELLQVNQRHVSVLKLFHYYLFDCGFLISQVCSRLK
jgi:hypothetical protein